LARGRWLLCQRTLREPTLVLQQVQVLGQKLQPAQKKLQPERMPMQSSVGNCPFL
jgi:hypothetical protein